MLDHLTRRIVHIGGNGAGCAMKLSVNLGMAIYLQSLAEAISLGRHPGRDSRRPGPAEWDFAVNRVLNLIG